VAGVLHEMPTVSDLGGVRKCLSRSKGVTAAAVARDHTNLLLPCESRLRSGWLSKSRSRKSVQGAKWNFCLTAGTLWPANREIP
jgi:hypothetical protein